MVKQQLMQMSSKILELDFKEGQPAELEPRDLDEAVAICDNALSRHEEAHLAVKLRLHRAEAQLVKERQSVQVLVSRISSARDFMRQFGEELHSIHDGAAPPVAQGRELRLEEAMAFCGAALKPLNLLKQVAALPEASTYAESSDITPQTTFQSSSDAPQPFKSNAQTLWQDMESDPGIASGCTGISLSSIWQKADACGVCNTRLGKRYFKWRYYCHLCGQCVCSSCSPSSILLEGEKEPKRTCTDCISDMMNGNGLQSRASLGTASMCSSGSLPDNLELLGSVF
jgi:hypothetical protein